MCAAHFIEGKTATAMPAAQGKRVGELEEALIAASAAPVQEILRGGRSPVAVSSGRERGRGGEREAGEAKRPPAAFVGPWRVRSGRKDLLCLRRWPKQGKVLLDIV